MECFDTSPRWPSDRGIQPPPARAWPQPPRPWGRGDHHPVSTSRVAERHQIASARGADIATSLLITTAHRARLGNLMLEAYLPPASNVVTVRAPPPVSPGRHPRCKKKKRSCSRARPGRRRVAAEAALTVNRITMELGGKARTRAPDPTRLAVLEASRLTFPPAVLRVGSRVLVEAGLHALLCFTACGEAGQTAVAAFARVGMGPLIHQGAFEGCMPRWRKHRGGRGRGAGGERREGRRASSIHRR